MGTKNIWGNFDFGDTKKKVVDPPKPLLTCPIKEAYQAIDDWYDKQDKNKIKVLINDKVFYDGSLFALFQGTMFWYLNIKELKPEQRELILGDKILTLRELTQHMLKSLPDKETLKNSIKNRQYNIGDEDDYQDECGFYDEDGYASDSSTLEIIDFWEKAKDRDIVDAAGYATDELDLDGGRCYYLRGSAPYLFNYLYYTLKMDAKAFDESICNVGFSDGGDLPDEICDFYATSHKTEEGRKIYLPDEKFIDENYERLTKKKNKEDIANFNHSIKRIIDDYSKKSEFRDKIETLRKLMI